MLNTKWRGKLSQKFEKWQKYLVLHNVILGMKYRKGNSIRQAPVFRHLRAFRKSPWKFIIWMMNYNYAACCWFPTSNNILILSSQFWQIRFESCWLHRQSAEYWCFYGREIQRKVKESFGVTKKKSFWSIAISHAILQCFSAIEMNSLRFIK